MSDGRDLTSSRDFETIGEVFSVLCAFLVNRLWILYSLHINTAKHDYHGSELELI